MPGYEKIESLKNGGSWGQFCWKTCGFERVNVAGGEVATEECSAANCQNYTGTSISCCSHK